MKRCNIYFRIQAFPFDPHKIDRLPEFFIVNTYVILNAEEHMWPALSTQAKAKDHSESCDL